MRLFVSLAIVFVLMASLTTLAIAADETLKGSVTCAKCGLKQADKCAICIKTKDGVVYFDDASHKKFHKEFCQATKEGTVTGTVTEKDGKKVVAVKKLDAK